ncbi:hypothetical protein GGR52DRAFT_353509 [Hypoxylon sp. FL1284]|nr:hypothetical protein GGR52DRAFT_353509 [Hypoxylon sp. FL1284]
MLSSIGRAAVKRLVSTNATQSIHRIALSRLAANAPKSNGAFVRTFAAPARPKESATKKKPAAAKAPASKEPTSTRSRSRAKPKPKSAPKSKSKSKARTGTGSKSATAKKSKTRKPRRETPEQRKERVTKLEKKELKERALFTEPKRGPILPWLVFVDQETKNKKIVEADFQAHMRQLSQNYKALPTSELQRLATKAEQNKADYVVQYKAWLERYTPQEISDARRARVALKKKYNFPVKARKPIHDERLPRKASNAYALYTKARWASGDLAGQRVGESAKQIGQEWNNMSATDRAPYEDLARSNLEHYEKEVQAVLHRPLYNRK